MSPLKVNAGEFAELLTCLGQVFVPPAFGVDSDLQFLVGPLRWLWVGRVRFSCGIGVWSAGWLLRHWSGLGSDPWRQVLGFILCGHGFKCWDVLWECHAHVIFTDEVQELLCAVKVC